jgi:DNA-directed RNA polymerase subunit RPC12/RpoP
MSPNEPYLKEYICPNCHAGMLQDHPEENFANNNYVKCNICGFVKKLIIKKLDIHKIVYGRDE